MIYVELIFCPKMFANIFDSWFGSNRLIFWLVIKAKIDELLTNGDG